MKNARPTEVKASARNSADCTKLRIVFASPLAADLLLLAVAAGLLTGGAA